MPPPTDSEWIWSEEHRDYYRYERGEDGRLHPVWGRSTIPPPPAQSNSRSPVQSSQSQPQYPTDHGRQRGENVYPQSGQQHVPQHTQQHSRQNHPPLRSQNQHSYSQQGQQIAYGTYGTPSGFPPADSPYGNIQSTGSYLPQPSQPNTGVVSENTRQAQPVSGYTTSHSSQTAMLASSGADPQPTGYTDLNQASSTQPAQRPCLYCGVYTHKTEEHHYYSNQAGQ